MKGILTRIYGGCSWFVIDQRQFAKIVALAEDCDIDYSTIFHLLDDFNILYMGLEMN